MKDRRSFLALVGGAAVSGLVTTRASAMSTRRGFMTFTAGAVATGTVPPIGAAHPHPDRELIGVCAEFDAIERHINSHYAGGSRKIEDDEERDGAIAPFQEAQAPLLERIIALRATTLDGFMARARTLALWDLDAMRQIGPGHYLEDRMLAALLRDMVGEARA